VRGARHRERIAETLTVLSEVRDQLVFLGGCVLGLYAAPSGSPLRVTDDVDCFSTVQPWALQLELLARLCADGVLTPDPKQAQRYRVRDTGLVIDVMSPEPHLQRGEQEHGGAVHVGEDVVAIGAPRVV
jgi:hypothetical protein